MGKIKDLTGQKFNSLTVLEITNERRNRQVVWKCKCDCGNITYVVGQALRTGHTKTCGCGNYQSKNANDLEGLTFSKLKVLKRIGTNEKRNAIWDCLCECGNHRECTSHQLTSLEVRSCEKCVNFASKGEQIIAELLTKNNINFIRQFTFKDLISKYNRNLKFDFAIVNNDGSLKYLIEYDGIQHSEPCELFGGEKGLKERQERDKIKNEYCKKHNITLLRINKDYRNLKIKDLLI